MGFICPSCSPHGAPVLFIQKKDRSLHLCCHFWGINRVSKKDQYPLLLINNLLDAPHKARIYTKIYLWHAYHLVCIVARDEWKTMFVSRIIFYYHPNIIAMQCVAITLLYIEQNVYGPLWVLGTI